MFPLSVERGRRRVADAAWTRPFPTAPSVRPPSLHAIPRAALGSASTGYFLQEFVSLPNYPGYSPNPVEAFSSVPPEGLAQIVIFMGWLEITANKVRRAAWRHVRASESQRSSRS